MDTYEKKYKEALELARDYYKANLKLYKADENVILEDIFPELKESEDEKIRKELIVFLEELSKLGKNTDFDKWKTSDCANWIAWLERQGEQKPYGQREECLDCQVNYAGECKGSCAMKRDEQKPTDETPYPETLEKAIDLYYYSYGNGKGEFEHLSLEKFRDIVHTFVSDYGQKPAWSEEDELVVKDIEKAIINYWFGQTQEDLLDWIKSLKQRIGE